MSTSLQIRRAVKEDAAEIGRIHVEARRSAYSGIYTDEYLAALSPDERARRWTTEGANSPDQVNLVAKIPTVQLVRRPLERRQ